MRQKTISKIITLLHTQPVRYLLSGAATAATEYGSFIILSQLSSNILIVNALSFILSLFVGFNLNKRWVFKATGSKKKQVSGYIVLAYVNLGLSSVLIWTLADIIGLMPLVAKLGTMLLIASSNYFLFSKLIFRINNPE
jgi:putative flippase GtrA